jgi:hypothetical protein
MNFLPPRSTRLMELAESGSYPAPTHCEIHTGSDDWQSNPDNVTTFGELVGIPVYVVPDGGHLRWRRIGQLAEVSSYPSSASGGTDLHVRELSQSIKECSATVNPTSPTVYVVNVSLGLCLFMGSGSLNVCGRSLVSTSRYQLAPLYCVWSSQDVCCSSLVG